MSIDIGPGAINRGDILDGSWYTMIDKNNPANISGTLSQVELWFANKLAENVKVGTFFAVDDQYECRDAVTIGDVAYGSKQTYTGLSLTVEAGDYLGIYYTAGNIERDTSGYSGVLYHYGALCDPEDRSSYTLLSGDAISIYATGGATSDLSVSDGFVMGDYATILGGSPYYGEEQTVTPLTEGITRYGKERSATPSAAPASSERSFTTLAAPVEEEVEISAVMLDGVGYETVRGSMSIEARIAERSTAGFTAIDLDADNPIVEGCAVDLYRMPTAEELGETAEVYSGAWGMGAWGQSAWGAGSQLVVEYDVSPVKLFGGFVDSIQSSRAAPSGGVLHDVICMDYCYIADKRRAAETYQNKYAGYIVADLWLTYLQPEGVTVGEIQQGPLVQEMVVNYGRVSDALDNLATKSGFIWNIDQDKKLWFIARETNLAPWAFTSLMAIGTPTLRKGNANYRNRQYIKGASITDEQTETFTGDDETKSFTVGYPLAQVPTITDNGAAVTVGIKGLDKEKDWYWSKGDAVLTTDTAPAAGHTISVTYRGQYSVMVMSYDGAAIASRKSVEGSGTGYVEDIADEAGTTTLGAVWQAANALLSKYCREGRRFEYETEEPGLFPGQLQHITYPLLGLDDDMLIESVSMRSESDIWVYSVTAIQGPEMGSWAKLFKAIADQVKIVTEKINVGLDELLIITEPVTEWEGWTEDVTETAYACPLIGATTLCGTGTTIC